MSRNARIASVVAVARAVRLAVRPGGPSIGERAGAVPRMVRATFSGEYVGVSKGRLMLMLAAAGYLVSPLDIIPEAVLPIVGLADDALVLSWLATKLVEETEAFLAWENGTMGAPTGPTGTGSGGAAYPGSPGWTGATGGAGAQNGATRPAAAQTVPGDVVR
ncbi:MAG TPA: YkvA family protein [Ornithinibacter sp.]|nr:YkvA family protein [Ornithinibacter sp.]